MNTACSTSTRCTLDVLVPAGARPGALAMALVSIGAQNWPALRVVVADRTPGAATLRQPDVIAALRYLQARGVKVNTWQ